MAIADKIRNWVYFTPSHALESSPFRHNPHVGIHDCASVKLNRYVVESTKVLRGESVTEFRPGEEVFRLFSNNPLLGWDWVLPAGVHVLSGVTQHLNYTDREQRARLTAISASELPPSNSTLAVLIPIRKTNEWWELPQDSRMAHFKPGGGKEGHTAIGEAFASKIYRQLMHARYLELPEKRYDFLTYFEFNEVDTPLFLELLEKLRNEDLNPEWRYVDREEEIWMRKVVAA